MTPTWHRCDGGHLWDATRGPLCPNCGSRPTDSPEGTLSEGPSGVNVATHTFHPSSNGFLTLTDDDSDEPTRPTPPPVPVIDGATFANYRIVRELGRGGMGVVYEAIQSGLNRSVALKMILAGEHAGTVALERFRREAEAVAAVRHPNIVQIYEIGVHDGRPFFALEMIEGGSLAARVGSDPWPALAAARLVEILARAISFAHRQGIIHRDLKPANILITHADAKRADFLPGDATAAENQTGLLKVTDFGLAKRVHEEEESSAPTHTGAVMGTPSYLSPEQAAGRNREVGPAADIYALGAILYELLTSRPPFHGETAVETILQVMRDEPVPPSRLRARLPRDLETICLKCLMKSPARRYLSAVALAEDLARFQRGEPIAARPIGPIERTRMWARRRPGTAATLVLGIISLIVLLAISFGVNLALQRAADKTQHEADLARDAKEHAEKLQHEAEQAKIEAIQRRAEAETARQELERGTYSLLLSQVAAIANHDPARARVLLDQAGRAHPEMREFTWHHLHRLTERTIADLPDAGVGGIYTLASSPSGRYIIVAGRDHRVLVYDNRTWQPISELVGHDQPLVKLLIHPGGKYLFGLDQRQKIHVWHLPIDRISPIKGGSATISADESIGEAAWAISTMMLSNDGRTLALGCGDGKIRLFEVDLPRSAPTMLVGSALQALPMRGPLLRAVAKIDDQRSAVLALAFSPDDRQLLSGGDDRKLRLYSLKRPKPLLATILDTLPNPISVIAWAGVGDYVAVVSNSEGGDHAIRLWRMDGHNRQVAIFRGHTQVVFALAFSPDGTLLASGGGDHRTRVWNLERRSEQFVFPGHTLPVTALAFSPDSLQLSAGGLDQRLCSWNLGDSATVSCHFPGRPTFTHAALSPDARHLAATDDHGTLVIAKLSDNFPANELPCLTVRGTPGRTLGLFFDAQGKRLARISSNHVELWELTENRLTLVPIVNQPPSPLRTAILGPDGTTLILAGDRELTEWSLESGQKVRQFANEKFLTLAVSADQRWLAAARGPLVSLFDFRTGKLPKEGGIFTLRDRADRLLFTATNSKTGRWKLAASHDTGSITFLEIEQHPGSPLRLTERAHPSAHAEPISALCISKDGQTLGSISHDRTLKFWDPDSGQERAALPVAPEPMVLAQFLPGDRALLTLDKEGVVRFLLRP